MSQEHIAIFMFASMMLMLFTGQRVFGAIGAIATIAALALWGTGGQGHSLFSSYEADEMVSAPDPADVHLHGICIVRKPPCG